MNTGVVRLLVIWGIVCVIGVGGPWKVLAQDSREEASQLRPGWYFGADLVGTYNSVGLYAFGEATWQKPYRFKHNMVWSHVASGLLFAASPAATRTGVHIEWMPVAFLTVRSRYDVYFYHGVFGNLIEFESRDRAHDEPDIYKLSGQERFGVGHRFWTNVVFMVPIGPMVIRNEIDFVGYVIQSDGPFVYIWDYATTIPPTAMVLGNRTSLLFNLLMRFSPRTLYAGPFYALVYIPSTQMRRQRVGLDVFTEPFGETKHLGKVRFYSIVGWNLEERYRTNEVFVVLGIGSTWDR